jgi:hypothetical protein
MKLFVAVMQLLSGDVRTDRQTDLANLKYANLKRLIQKVLRIISARPNHPAVPEITTISQLTLPLEKQRTACCKEAELDHSSHSYCTPCPHEPLRSSAQNEHPPKTISADHIVAVKGLIKKLSSYLF